LSCLRKAVPKRCIAWRRGPVGVEEQGMHVTGFSRNLGGPAVSTSGKGNERVPQEKRPQACIRYVRVGTRSEQTGKRWYPSMKETKCEEKGSRKSEHSIVPVKQGNRTRRDPVEGRECRIMESLEGKMPETSSSANISTKLQRVATLARKAPGMVFTTLAHLIDVDFFREAYRRTRKDAAAGIDGKTAEEYSKQLEENLKSLLNRFKRGSYWAPALRRVYIAKEGNKRMRPIGVPSFEDKVLQRAVVMVLEAVYEQDFYDCSYGFRPGRSAHAALKILWEKLMGVGGGWVIKIDIQEFFDTLDHEHLRKFLDRRVRDGVIRRIIGKWLKAGVMEDGRVTRPECGTPQGGVISPLLANVYLHEVLDKWFEEVVKPRMRERSYLFRYADDAVMVFAKEYDARRVLEVLPKRFEKFGLRLNLEKTRLVYFNRPGTASSQSQLIKKRPETFDFLGFTHYWGKSRRKRWIVKNKTASQRLGKALKAVAQWCRQNRHLKAREQHKMLCLKMRGHYQYYGITTNGKALQMYYYEVRRIWRKWLGRRSHRAGMDWERFSLLTKQYPLPIPRVVHSVSRSAACF